MSTLAISLLPATISCTKVKQTTPPPAGRTYTFRALAGISMGGIGSSFLTGTGDNHKRLDALAALGGPIDVAYFLGGFERMQMGGFCPLDRLEALAASNPAALNDPTQLTDCAKPNMPYGYEHAQSFNHWQFTTSGGTFDRSSYLHLFYDLSLALGNPLMYNPSSPIFPTKDITRTNFTPDLCDHPIVYKGDTAIYNKEYNPEGKYPVITFCDGEEPVLYCDDAKQTPVDFCSNLGPDDYCKSIGGTKSLEAGKGSDQNPDLYFAKKGAYEPCYHHTEPVPFGLAVDINGNGKRDYLEPIIINAHERFSDWGKDGCPDDREDGKGGCTAQGQTGDPNGDNFDYTKNPFGTEGNFLHDDGEPYEDNGLDGVPNTHDFGEANGKYDDSPNRQHWLESDFRQHYAAWSEQERKNLDVYADGGNRDVFNFGLSAQIMTSVVRSMEPNESKAYTQFEQLPPQDGVDWANTNFTPLDVDFDQAGRNMLMIYGSENPSLSLLRDGDGDHVGTPGQVLNRFQTFIRWMSHHWEKVLGEPVQIDGKSRRETVVYNSAKLGGPRNFDIALPIGYDDPANANKRYPVFFMGHGYGMNSADMANISAIFDSFAQAGYILPMITVYPSGRCCFIKPDGTKDCRDRDENGNDLSQTPGYFRECLTGNFYVNRQGFEPGDSTPYGDGIFEIMDYVDAHYRTLPSMTVQE